MADLEKIKEKLKADEDTAHDRMVHRFETMKPFNGDVNRIPDIPITDQETYKNIIIPNLIRCGAIPKNKLEIGKTYIGDCRNATKAEWTGKEFKYMRTKFGFTYPETINHFEDDDGYDLFVPIQKIETKIKSC